MSLGGSILVLLKSEMTRKPSGKEERPGSEIERGGNRARIVRIREFELMGVDKGGLGIGDAGFGVVCWCSRRSLAVLVGIMFTFRFFFFLISFLGFLYQVPPDKVLARPDENEQRTGNGSSETRHVLYSFPRSTYCVRCGEVAEEQKIWSSMRVKRPFHCIA